MSSCETHWIEKRQKSFVFTFWYLTEKRKMSPKSAHNVILFSRGLSKEHQDEVDKMVRTSGFRRAASFVFVAHTFFFAISTTGNSCLMSAGMMTIWAVVQLKSHVSSSSERTDPDTRTHAYVFVSSPRSRSYQHHPSTLSFPIAHNPTHS